MRLRADMPRIRRVLLRTWQALDMRFARRHRHMVAAPPALAFQNAS